MSGSDFAVMDVATVSLVLLLNLGRAASAMASGLAERAVSTAAASCAGADSGRATVWRQMRDLLEVFENAQ
jgi:hypothetical protein